MTRFPELTERYKEIRTLDLLFEILFELIFEGCIAVAEEKKVPLPLRILCAAFLVVVYAGFVGILLYIAIVNRSVLMGIIVAALGILLLFAFIYKFAKIKKKRIGQADS